MCWSFTGGNLLTVVHTINVIQTLFVIVVHSLWIASLSVWCRLWGDGNVALCLCFVANERSNLCHLCIWEDPTCGAFCIVKFLINCSPVSSAVGEIAQGSSIINNNKAIYTAQICRGCKCASSRLFWKVFVVDIFGYLLPSLMLSAGIQRVENLTNTQQFLTVFLSRLFLLRRPFGNVV